GRVVPNLTESMGGVREYGGVYTLRGIGNTEFLSDPGVVVYVDDVPFADVISFSPDLLAVDRLDVYRGPQGSRFGKNAEAGVINISTHQPSDRFEATASASGGSYGTEQYRASGQGPLVKGTLGLSLAGQYSASDGFMRNTFLHTDADPREALDGRARLWWMPAENWDFAFT